MDAAQWLQVLEIRTRGTAHGIITRTSVIQIEVGPEQALETVWEWFNERFIPQQKPSEHLMSNLTNGSNITTNDTEAS